MDIPEQFQQVCLFFANDGFIAVLEKMAGSLMFPVEGDGISGQQPTHEMAKGAFGSYDKQMKMIRH